MTNRRGFFGRLFGLGIAASVAPNLNMEVKEEIAAQDEEESVNMGGQYVITCEDGTQCTIELI